MCERWIPVLHMLWTSTLPLTFKWKGLETYLFYFFQNCVCVCVCMCAPRQSLELELQAVLSFEPLTWVLGIELWSFGRETHSPNY